MLKLPTRFPNKKIMAVDIGGTLTKVAFFLPQGPDAANNREELERLEQITSQCVPIELANGDRIFLRKFHSSKVDEFVDWAVSNDLVGDQLHATGGGAYKYAEQLEKAFPLTRIYKHDEMQSMVGGLSFILKNAKTPTFELREQQKQNQTEADSPTVNAKPIDRASNWTRIVPTTPIEFPTLLVSIGSGVSIIKVNSATEYERVSGTMIGGGTLVGLSNLLTGIKDFDEIIKRAQNGNNGNVDMLVKDIYGTNSPFKELDGDILASSFGKIAYDQKEGAVKGRHNTDDILNSLVTMISFNIGQLAFYCSSMHSINSIHFVGSYVRDNYLACQQINFAVDFMSEKTVSPRFVEYDSYLGAIGAFMQEFEPSKIEKQMSSSPKGKAKAEESPKMK